MKAHGEWSHLEGGDQLVDQHVVGLPPDPRLLESDIEGVVAHFRHVAAGVNHNREDLGRRDSACNGV